MALRARVTEVKAEQSGVAWAVACEFFDDAKPAVVLFAESFSFDAGADRTYAKQVIADYAVKRASVIRATKGIAAGDTFACE